VDIAAPHHRLLSSLKKLISTHVYRHFGLLLFEARQIAFVAGLAHLPQL
jgi:hypothetical protein